MTRDELLDKLNELNNEKIKIKYKIFNIIVELQQLTRKEKLDKKLERILEYKKLREEGLTYEEIGKKFGITRQAVQSFLTAGLDNPSYYTKRPKNKE